MSIESVMPSNHLILCRPFLLLPSVFPSIMVFSDESVLSIRWPKYWSFSISPSNEYLRLISFRMDWLDLLAVQGTLTSLLKMQVRWAGIPISFRIFQFIVIHTVDGLRCAYVLKKIQILFFVVGCGILFSYSC